MPQSSGAQRKRYPNSGIISRNQHADEHPKRAPYNGSCSLDCPCCGEPIDFWINAWVKEGQRGKFFGLQFKAKDRDPSAPRSARAPIPSNAEPEVPRF